MSIRVGAVLAVVIAATAPARADVTVFLERNGFVTEEGIEIPRFGGGDRTWQAVVSCVRAQYAPFKVDIVEHKPARGSFITAVVGGNASLLGLDDETTNGVGPFDGNVEPDAVVHIFSRVGTGEHDVENLCAVTTHEVGHALGLDHEIYCGDVMSYYLDRCGARTFIAAEAPCGETERRRCASGAATQSSYRRLGELVGFRDPAAAGTDRANRSGVDDPDIGPTNTGDSDAWPDGDAGQPDSARDDDGDDLGPAPFDERDPALSGEGVEDPDGPDSADDLRGDEY
jgi:hypothetical protein